MNPIERCAHLSVNARAKPGDTLVLYHARGFDISKREYTADQYQLWRPSGDERDWPHTLSGSDLERLGRGWALPGGYHVTRRGALEAEAFRMRKRAKSLERQLGDARAFLERAEREGLLS